MCIVYIKERVFNAIDSLPEPIIVTEDAKAVEFGNVETEELVEISKGISNVADIICETENTEMMKFQDSDNCEEYDFVDEKSPTATEILRQYRLECAKSENEKLKKMLICKNCETRAVETLNLPCKHIVCCENCADILDLCPLCSKRILGTVRIYMA